MRLAPLKAGGPGLCLGPWLLLVEVSVGMRQKSRGFERALPGVEVKRLVARKPRPGCGRGHCERLSAKFLNLFGLRNQQVLEV